MINIITDRTEKPHAAAGTATQGESGKSARPSTNEYNTNVNSAEQQMRFYPEGMKRLPIWILWALETNKDGKLTKIPKNPKRYGNARSNDSSTWADYETALKKWRAHPEQYNGIGIMLAEENGIIFIDFDHCIDSLTGEIDSKVTEALESFGNTYSEYSQSGTGIHIFCYGKIPKGFKNSLAGVEMYNSKRFAALTGNALVRAEIGPQQAAIDELYKKYAPTERAATGRRNGADDIIRTDIPVKADSWIIEKASARGKRFAELFAGNWQPYYGSHSEADMGLCMLLAFWTDADAFQMDRLFRQSALYRQKWERTKYREETINRAINNIDETFSQWRSRTEQEKGAELERVYLSAW